MKRFTIFLLFVCTTFLAKATHNRAGQITYEQISALEIRVTVTTYTKANAQVDRDSILLDWGDGQLQYIVRSNGLGDATIGNNAKKNLYIATHIYPGRGEYTISMTDPNRVGEIQNLNYPNSENIEFHLFTTFSLLTGDNFNGFNSSVVLEVDPIDIACIDQPYIHIPGAFDPDDDSLAFELTVPYDGEGNQVSDYQLPDEIIPQDNNFTFDTSNGTILWETPKKAGEYNVAFLIKEYRNGKLLTTVLRDMQIFVLDCSNQPPQIEVPEEICIIAGDSVEFNITVNDPDIGQEVLLTSFGPLFDLKTNPAVLIGPDDYTATPFTATFKWKSRCEDISKNPYEIIFRASDKIGNLSAGLADLKATRIRVVGPPPENLEGESDKEKITLTWDLPYLCEETENMFFQGFSIWRATQSITIPPDTCDPGIEGKGYLEVGKVQLISEDGKYIFEDFEVQKGRTYCYRVVAEFARLSNQGDPYNFIQSLVSNEVCLQLARDIPLLTKVSVNNTDISDGEIRLEWIKPDPVDLDTLLYPGPYRYQLQHSLGINTGNFTDILGAEVVTENFADEADLTFLHEGLDTETTGHNYRIAFYADGTNTFYDHSPESSSVYLSVSEADQQIELSWQEFTSWINIQYYIYRFDTNSSTFELIDSTENSQYINDGLTNGEEYCYLVESKGTYLIPELPEFLYNFSQQNCGIPIDVVPPCSPEIIVTNSCESASDVTPAEDFINTIIWDRVDFICDNSADIDHYNIYFKYSLSDEFEKIGEVNDIQVTSYDHKPDTGLTACYAISSVDSVGNESPLSNVQCIDDCPSYILPNAFTPNSDGSNDTFRPILNRFVSRITFTVYNEWGQKVYETSDPEINWNGTNFSGSQLNDGVYYYTCEVFQSDPEVGEYPFDFLKGYVQIINAR